MFLSLYFAVVSLMIVIFFNVLSNCVIIYIRQFKHITLWATDWTIGVLGFDSRRGLGIFLFTTVCTTALGPTQPPIRWVQGALSLRVKRPRREADHSPPGSVEVK
jgi:hypothetical protein